MPAVPRWPRRAAYVAAGLALTGALGTLLAWGTGAYTLLAFVPGFPSLKANAAVALALLGGALLLAIDARARGRRVAATILALAAAGIAAATLLQDALGVGFGIDELFFADVTVDDGLTPGRMSIVTAACVLLLALAIVSLDAGRRTWVPSVAVHLTGALLLVAGNGYIYGAPSLTGATEGRAGIPLPGILLLFLLGTGVLLSRPERGVVRLALREDLAGRVARALLPLALLLPLAAGVVTWTGATLELYDRRLAQALLVASLTIALVVAVTRTTWLIARADERRAEALRALEASQRELEKRVEERTRDLAAANESLRERSVTRELAQRVLALGGRDLSVSERRQLGRSLAAELAPTALPGALASFHDMGAGTLEAIHEEGARWTFGGTGMLEVKPDQTTPTCALALGYLEGAMAAISRSATLGSEVRCASQGHPRCEFVIAARPAPPVERGGALGVRA